MTEEKTKLLNLMKFWLFGTFVIVWAAVTAYIGMFTNRDWMMAIQAGFPIWGITGGLTIVWYLFYRWWLGRKGESAPPMMESTPIAPTAEASESYQQGE
jgi:hypothetical protein